MLFSLFLTSNLQENPKSVPNCTSRSTGAPAPRQGPTQGAKVACHACAATGKDPVIKCPRLVNEKWGGFGSGTL